MYRDESNHLVFENEETLRCGHPPNLWEKEVMRLHNKKMALYLEIFEELVALAVQYRDDLRHPPKLSSVDRRLKRIQKVLDLYNNYREEKVMGATKKAMLEEMWKETEAQEKAQRLKDEEEERAEAIREDQMIENDIQRQLEEQEDERLLEEQIEEDIQRQEAEAG